MVWVSGVGKFGRIEMRLALNRVPSRPLGKCLGETSMQVWPLVPVQRWGMDAVSQVRASYRAVSLRVARPGVKAPLSKAGTRPRAGARP